MTEEEKLEYKNRNKVAAELTGSNGKGFSKLGADKIELEDMEVQGETTEKEDKEVAMEVEDGDRNEEIVSYEELIKSLVELSKSSKFDKVSDSNTPSMIYV